MSTTEKIVLSFRIGVLLWLAAKGILAAIFVELAGDLQYIRSLL